MEAAYDLWPVHQDTKIPQGFFGKLSIYLLKETSRAAWADSGYVRASRWFGVPSEVRSYLRNKTWPWAGRNEFRRCMHNEKKERNYTEGFPTERNQNAGVIQKLLLALMVYYTYTVGVYSIVSAVGLSLNFCCSLTIKLAHNVWLHVRTRKLSELVRVLVVTVST